MMLYATWGTDSLVIRAEHRCAQPGGTSAQVAFGGEVVGQGAGHGVILAEERRARQNSCAAPWLYSLLLCDWRLPA